MTILGPGNVAGALTINIASATDISANTINFTDTSAVSLLNTSGSNRSLTLQAGLTTGSGAVTIGSSTANQNINIALGASQTWNIGSGGLTASNIISGTGFGLTKTGVGTLVLSGVNTYTGGTTINTGTVQLTQTSGAAATGTFNLGGGALQLNQGGNNFAYNPTLNLTAGSTFGNAGNGAINYQAGTLTGNSHALTINNDANRIYINGTVSGITQFNVTKGALGFDMSVGSNRGGGAAVNVGNNASLWVVGANTTNNNITLNGGVGYNSTGALFQENSANTTTLSGTLTLNNGVSSIGVGNAGGTIILSGKVTGSGGITKIGVGTLTLSGSTNDYTGTTTVNQGTLAITGNSTGLTGALAANALNTNSTTTTAGTLTLNGNTGSLASNAAVALNGGIFNYQAATTGSTLDASGYTFTGGDRNYRSTYGTSGNAVLNLANATRTAGTTNNYSTSGGTNGTTNKITFTSAPTTNALVDKGDYFGGSSYLAYDSTNSAARAYSYSTDANGATSTGGATLGSVTGMNVDLTTAAVTAQTTDSINTLRLGTTNGVAITAANTLSVDGILKSGANSATISGGSVQAVSSGGELVIRTDASGDTLIISSAIANNGGSSLTKSGLGILTLSSANGYTGGTNLNAGILNVGNATALGTGAVNMNGGTLRGAVGSNFNLANNIVVGGGENRITVGANQNVTLTGALSGAGNLTIGGAGTNNASVFVNLSGNTMTSGTITLANDGAGVARVQSTASTSAALNWIISGSGPSIENAGTYNFGSFGGSGNLFYQGAGNAIYSVGGLNNDATYSGVMSRTNGNASLSLLKIGTGSWTLSGANTFSQAGSGAAATTTVRDGSLIAGTNALSGVAGAFGNSTTAIVLGDATTISSGTAMNPKLLIGGVFNVGRDITVGANNNALGNAGTTFTIGGSTANTSTFSGTTTVNQNLAVTQVTDGTLNLTGNITSGSSGTQTVTFNNVGSVSQSTGVIGGGTGTIAVAQTGAGTTTLSGANTYTGGTTVNGGTLVAGNSSALGTGAVSIGGGSLQSSVATVSGLGNVSMTSGNLTINTGGVGTLTLATGSTFAMSGGTWNLDLSALDSIVGTGTSTFSVGGTSTFALSNVAQGSYNLLTSFNTSGNTLDTTSVSFTGLSGGLTASLSTTGGTLTLTVVPEPHEFAIAIVALLGVLVFIRRRNQQV